MTYATVNWVTGKLGNRSTVQRLIGPQSSRKLSTKPLNWVTKHKNFTLKDLHYIFTDFHDCQIIFLNEHELSIF